MGVGFSKRRKDPPGTGKQAKHDDGQLRVNKSNGCKMKDTEWRNIADEVYKEEKGEEEFLRKRNEEIQPPPALSVFSAVQLRHETNKIKFLFAAKTLQSRLRATHPYGVGALGTVTIVQEPKFPATEFFSPGRKFIARLRHSSVKFDDDTMVDFKSASLKFADSDSESPFDLVLATGKGAVGFNTKAVIDAAKSARKGTVTAYKEYLLKKPEYLWINIDGLRRTPDSLTDQRYYSKCCLDFKAEDGVKRYVKFRLLPADGTPETGLLTETEQRKVWDRSRYPHETRSKTYLKDEFKQRLREGPIHYLLQLQLHEAREDDPWQIFHAGRASWDENTHPWLDVGHVTMTSLLPSDVTERMQFNVDNLPSSLAIVPAVSMHDSRCVNVIRAEVYAITQKIRHMIGANKDSDSLSPYYVSVETGEQKGSNTDANVSILITGTLGCTDAILLDKRFHDDMERGQTDEYLVKGIDVGEILDIKLKNDQSGLNADWFVGKVVVTHCTRGDVYKFPCYRWVIDELVLYQGKALLPHQEQHELIKGQRHVEITKRQQQYQWKDTSIVPDMPGFIAAQVHEHIPKDSQFSDVASKSFLRSRLCALTNLGLTSLLTLSKNFHNLEEFSNMFTSLVADEIPKLSEKKTWMDDTVFGMQYLNGVNPIAIERCDGLPTAFPVTDELIGNLLDRDLNLEQEIQAGHIYIVSFKDLEGVKRSNEGTSDMLYVTEPVALFYVRASGDLVPLAIQLYQEHSDTNPIWTPNDEPLDWMFAKMWLKCADLQHHQMVVHLLRTHLVMEAIAVATWRQLPSVHPIHKLLFPHVRSVMAINTLGRKELIGEGGISDEVLSIGGGGHIQIIQKFYKNKFTWALLDVPEELKRRGVDDVDKLPGFYYRDDALRLWKAIQQFVNELLAIYYVSDDDVTQDGELQAWMKDLAENGYPQGEDHVDHEFPATLESREQLVHLMTCVVFNCSCQHAAVNFGMFEKLSYVPNSPPAMRLPPPTKKGVTDMEHILKTLPNKKQGALHVGVMNALTRFAADEKYLGDYTDGLFADDEATEVFERFQENLQQISSAIKERNKGLEWPYVYLLPERVPCSIAI